MKRKSKLYRIVFFLVISLYFIYKLIYGLFIKPPDTEIVEYGSLSTERQYECLIIRNEMIVKSTGEGNIKYYVEEGEKVEKNYKICEIYTSDVSDKDREKIKELNDRIADIKSSKSNMFEIDIDKLNHDINMLIDDIRDARIQGDFEKIKKLKSTLENKINKKRRISGDKSFSGANLEKLHGEKERLEKKIKNSIMEINSPQSGIVSYHIDGYEEILTPYNLANIKYEFIKSIESNLNKLKYDKVIYDQPVFKITDNTAWYIVIITDLQDANTFNTESDIFIDFSDEKISGRVFDKIYDENKSFIIVRTNQYVNGFNKIRKLGLNIIKEQYEGLKINRDSIIEKEGQLGVYVLDINRKAVFKPIKVLGYNEDYAIIQNHFFDVKKGDSTKRIYTVKLYDEILRHGKKYREGDIIY
ncbi:HlyD family efflux transporter periplasmic adaptor subunit [Paramaledivibacter caminithermalis]|uniref:Putative membrane fusion protein n=1 Tax=Paramaledivibacter caminithermalis (strain DSM 15212 / CIP 107654 / DViRD3) TaxID=1121301 RepID=A0A1M6S351_PARC5|nr:HlyD family efflux transporter periplasmic adaptor subunit [Paramaledivibacter caminithermalis]SHK39252.1 putative membrane fusion protein [Paramaledivibacter caminithermalis DSM 15212]